METGIGTWTKEDFERAIRSGLTPDGEAIRLPMPWPQLRNMTDEDLTAIWLHLQTIEPISNKVKENEIVSG